MTGIARLNDIGLGVCPCHPIPVPYTTTLVAGNVTTRNNALGTTGIGAIGIASCGHATTAVTGSITTRIEGKAVHRLGDQGMNCGAYTMVLGSADTRVNT